MHSPGVFAGVPRFLTVCQKLGEPHLAGEGGVAGVEPEVIATVAHPGRAGRVDHVGPSREEGLGVGRRTAAPVGKKSPDAGARSCRSTIAAAAQRCGGKFCSIQRRVSSFGLRAADRV
jgi:hypothetical protein